MEKCGGILGNESSSYNLGIYNKLSVSKILNLCTSEKNHTKHLVYGY